MPKKHHAIYSDPTGAAASASPAKRRTARAKRTELLVDGTSAPAAEPGVTQEPIADRDAVARLAYSYWEARGFIGGSPEEDWLRAENEIRNNHAASAIA